MSDIKIKYKLKCYSRATNETVTAVKIFDLEHIELGLVPALDPRQYAGGKLEILSREVITEDNEGK